MLKEELEITASLACLELSGTEMDRFSESVDRILEYFSVMERIDVDGLEPTTHALLSANRTRADRTVAFVNNSANNNPNANSGANPAGNSNSDLLNNVPEIDGRLISIPNIL
jgi:aspartyl-tRNA(Asn)/glutamyl-tRNA(Gln) amidotransferase subunit C